MTAYAPLGSGDLGGDSLLDAPAVRYLAEASGVTTAQLLLRWALERGCSIVPRSVNPERIAQNAAAAVAGGGALLPADAPLNALPQRRRHTGATFVGARGAYPTLAALWDED